jgi:hypothetical protein
MSDLRSRLPGQSVIQRTLELHPDPTQPPSGDALSWYKGALGEVAVAGILAELSPKWTVCTPSRSGGATAISTMS